MDPHDRPISTPRARAPHASPAAPTPPSTAVAPPAEGAIAAALERLAQRDPSAVGLLHDQLAPTLLAVALRVTGSRADAEEVVQDALVRAWRDAPAFDRARGSAVAWLITLTRNRAIDVVRARNRRDRYETAAFEPASHEPAVGPEQSAAEAEYAAVIRRVLATLSPEQRRVLDLAYFAGLSHSEIAARLAQPLGTVKSRIAQAVQKLRAGLAAHEIDPRPSNVDPA